MSSLLRNTFLFIIDLLIPWSLLAQIDTTTIYEADTIHVEATRYLRIPQYNEITMKIPLPLIDTPVSVGIVTKKIIEDQNALILSDALKNISGVNVQSNLGTQDYFIIRGFESNTSGLILTDGINEPDVSLFRFYGYGLYDLYNVDQIEVLKGPAAFLYGGNTLSGTVNLIRKKPIFQNFIRVTGMYGKFNHYRTLIDISISDHQQKAALRFNGLWQKFYQYRDGKHGDNIALNPVLRWNFNPYHFISLNIEYLKGKKTPDTGIPLFIPDENWQLPEVPSTLSFQTPFDELNQELLRTRLNYQWTINEILTIRNNLFFSKLEGTAKITMAHIPHRDASGSWILDRHMFSFIENQYSLGNQLEVLIDFNSGTISHTVSSGFEIKKLQNMSDRALSTLPTTRLFQPVTKETSFDQLSTLTKIETKASSLVFAPYFIASSKIFDSLRLFFGGRFDFLNFNTDRQNTPFDYILKDLTSKPERLEQWHKKFSPMIGILFKDSKQLRFYLNFGKSFGQGLRVIDNPEESTQYEFGYKYISESGKIQNSVAIYQLTKRNMTIPLTGPLQGNKQIQSGSQRSRGFEIEFVTQFLPNWYSFLNYTYTEADLLQYYSLTVDKYLSTTIEDFSGNRPAFVPAQIMNFWTVKEFLNGIGIGLGINYISNQFVHVDNDFEIGGHYTLNASIFYNFVRGGWHINLKNLTNAHYFSRGFGPYSIIPAELFSIQVGVYFIL